MIPPETRPATITVALSVEDLDLVNSRTAYEVGQRKRIASMPATRLGGFMELMRDKFKPYQACALLGIDEGQLYEFWLSPNYDLTQEQLDIINKLYALGAGAMHESNRNRPEARRRLTTPMDSLRTDRTDPTSPERSVIEAAIAGDLDLAISVMDYQIGDVNLGIISRDS
jgi:hypothetical protein